MIPLTSIKPLFMCSSFCGITLKPAPLAGAPAGGLRAVGSGLPGFWPRGSVTFANQNMIRHGIQLI